MLSSVFAMETVGVGGSRVQRGWTARRKTDKPFQEFFPEWRGGAEVMWKRRHGKTRGWLSGTLGAGEVRGKNSVYQVFLLGVVKQWEEAEAKYPGQAGQALLPCT